MHCLQLSQILLQEKNLGIEYEYNVAISSDNHNSSAYVWHSLPWTSCSLSCGKGVWDSCFKCRKGVRHSFAFRKLFNIVWQSISNLAQIHYHLQAVKSNLMLGTHITIYQLSVQFRVFFLFKTVSFHSPLIRINILTEWHINLDYQVANIWLTQKDFICFI